MARSRTRLTLRRMLPTTVAGAVTLTIVFLLQLGVVPAQAQSRYHHSGTASTLTVEGRLAVFDDAWQTIFDRYYDSHFRGVDWMAQRAVFRPQAAEAADGPELYAVLRRLVATLNDVHTRVYGPDEKFDWWNPRYVSIGLTVRGIGGLPTVVRVEKGSAPEGAGIRPGDVIEEVNGDSALRLINEQFSRQPTIAMRPASRLRAFTTLMDGAPHTYINLQWRTKQGELRFGRFEREWRGRKLGLRVRREQQKFVVIELDAFTPTIALDFTRLINKKLTGARGIIIDLRGNGGGEAESMADVASSFLKENLFLGTFTDRWGVSFNIKTRAKSLLASEPLMRTPLPVVVLVGERTSSAAEIFAAAMQATHRATIIGTETCGCVLAIRNPHTLPDGGMLDVSELDYRTSGGDRLEENSIKPDKVVTPLRTDFYSNRDRALEAALKLLSQTSPRH